MYVALGEAVDVNEDKKTFNFRPVADGDNIDLYEVQIEASVDIDANGAIINSPINGFALIPKEGSKVVVGFFNENDAILLHVSQVDKVVINCDNVVFNGGDNGGLINIQSLVEKINRLENNYNIHTHPTPSGVSSATTTLITPVTSVTDLEDDKITH